MASLSQNDGVKYSHCLFSLNTEVSSGVGRLTSIRVDLFTWQKWSNTAILALIYCFADCLEQKLAKQPLFCFASVLNLRKMCFVFSSLKGGMERKEKNEEWVGGNIWPADCMWVQNLKYLWGAFLSKVLVEPGREKMNKTNKTKGSPGWMWTCHTISICLIPGPGD